MGLRVVVGRDKKEELHMGIRRPGEVINMFILTVVMVSQGNAHINVSNQILSICAVYCLSIIPQKGCFLFPLKKPKMLGKIGASRIRGWPNMR